jgi:hypothetical protein
MIESGNVVYDTYAGEIILREGKEGCTHDSVCKSVGTRVLCTCRNCGRVQSVPSAPIAVRGFGRVPYSSDRHKEELHCQICGRVAARRKVMAMTLYVPLLVFNALACDDCISGERSFRNILEVQTYEDKEGTTDSNSEQMGAVEGRAEG